MNNHQILKKIVAIFLLCMLTLLSSLSFVGCNVENANESENTVTFTDALNREITIKKNPKRVASLLGSFAEVWILSGGEICATAEDGWEDFQLNLDNAVNIGGAHSPSLELLLSSNPEFVIASASTSSNVAMQEVLQAMQIPVAYFDVDNFYDYLQMLDVCTNITGRKDLYEKNGLALQAKIEEIKRDYSALDIPTEQKRILLLRASSNFVKAKGSNGTILGEMLADLGCINIADSEKTLLENLSVEVIIRENPYYIFTVTMGKDTQLAQNTFENMLKDNPAWNTLDAIQQNRVFVMDKTLYNLKPNARWAEAYEKLYEKFTKK